MKTLQVLVSLVFFIMSLNTFAQIQEGNPPNACQCQFSHKDYDPEKGYYFDKVDYFPLPTISGRFGCIYYCQDSQGQYWYVEHTYQNSYFGWEKGGVSNAKKFICPSSVQSFHPKYDTMGTLLYYETTPYGNFSAAQTSIAELKNWASSNQCQ